MSALVIKITPAAAAISSQVLGLFSGGAGPTGASQVVTGGSGMLTGTSKVVTGDLESSGICFEEITPHNVVEISSRGHISFVSVLEVKMNYAVLNKSDEVKDGTLGLVPGTSRRPW